MSSTLVASSLCVLLVLCVVVGVIVGFPQYWSTHTELAIASNSEGAYYLDFPTNVPAVNGAGGMLYCMLFAVVKHPDKTLMFSRFPPLLNKKKANGVKFRGSIYAFLNELKCGPNDGWEFQHSHIYTGPKEVFDRRRQEMYEGFHANFEFDPSLRAKVDKTLFSKVKPGGRIIGLHVRRPGHYNAGTPGSYEKMSFEQYIDLYIEEIDKIINDYDGIFVATHTKKSIDILKRRYGDKIIVLNNQVNNHELDWNEGLKPSQQTFDKLRYEVFGDLYALTQCNLIIGAMSNVYFLALALNPEADFILLKHFIGKRSG